MPLPNPAINASHGTLNVLLDRPLQRTDETNDRIAAALAPSFPSQSPAFQLPPGAPDDMPHLLLQSRSSQVALSRVQADFEVRFYDAYRSSFERTRAYVQEKMRAILAAWEAVGAEPVFADIALTLQYSMHEQGEQLSPAKQLLDAHLRHHVSPHHVEDAKILLSLRLRDHYFVNLGIGTYEARTISRPMLAGTQQQIVRPWDGTVTDSGLQLDIAVNNRYYAIQRHEHPRVTNDELDAIVNLAWQIGQEQAAGLMEAGEIDLESLEGVVL
jgi:hypothetical protein